ncbi:MAG: hypothetical protein PF572_02140 [Patescibacteria group bacterium]|jgi:hypothetical protein|nr:hypothetical protein [Patescibacteria group bacterium]
MEKSKKSLKNIIALSAIIATFGVTAYAGASFGGFGLDQVQRDAMKQAVEEGDYESWKNIEDSKVRITDIITEENFDQFSQMHNLIQSGDVEAAKLMREELGLPERGGERMGGMMGSHGMREGDEGRNGSHNVGIEAIESADYDAWKEAVGDTRMSEVIENEADFQKLIEAHTLIKDGNFEEANIIHEELGLERGGMDREGRMGGKWQGRVNLNN